MSKTQSGTTTATTTSFVHGHGIDEPLSLERNSQKYYYHADGLGSITSMTDSTQAVVNRYSYDSFGRIQRAETVWNDYTFTGREYDSETGLLFLRARYYDPEAGRFVSKDPIGFAGGDVNVYNYTSGNPVNYTDPSGRLAFPWHFVLTFIASMNSGNGTMDSLQMAWRTMAVDFAPRAQGTSAEVTRQHAMAGVLSTGKYQSSEQAIAAVNSFIRDSVHNGNFAAAIHAAQDLATPSHAGNEWHKFGWNLESLIHILGDMFPSLSTISEAYKNTSQILNGEWNNCN